MSRTMKPKLKIKYKLPLKIRAAVIQYISKQLILRLEYCIKNCFLKPRFEKQEELTVAHYFGGVVPELLLIKLSNIFKNKLGK